eukprot:1156777-Pelagomonas_calceolata.AAC.7
MEGGMEAARGTKGRNEGPEPAVVFYVSEASKACRGSQQYILPGFPARSLCTTARIKQDLLPGCATSKPCAMSLHSAAQSYSGPMLRGNQVSKRTEQTKMKFFVTPTHPLTHPPTSTCAHTQTHEHAHTRTIWLDDRGGIVCQGHDVAGVCAGHSRRDARELREECSRGMQLGGQAADVCLQAHRVCSASIGKRRSSTACSRFAAAEAAATGACSERPNFRCRKVACAPGEVCNSSTSNQRSTTTRSQIAAAAAAEALCWKARLQRPGACTQGGCAEGPSAARGAGTACSPMEKAAAAVEAWSERPGFGPCALHEARNAARASAARTAAP